MKGCDLQNAAQVQFIDHGIRHLKKIIEVQKILQSMGQDQQRGVALFRIGLCQCFQLTVQILGHGFGIRGLADSVVNLSFDMHTLGEGAEVEPDHRLLQPAHRVFNDKLRRKLLIRDSRDFSHDSAFKNANGGKRPLM